MNCQMSKRNKGLGSYELLDPTGKSLVSIPRHPSGTLSNVPLRLTKAIFSMIGAPVFACPTSVPFGMSASRFILLCLLITSRNAGLHACQVAAWEGGDVGSQVAIRPCIAEQYHAAGHTDTISWRYPSCASLRSSKWRRVHTGIHRLRYRGQLMKQAVQSLLMVYVCFSILGLSIQYYEKPECLSLRLLPHTSTSK
jgi:hypothetical protein